MSEKEKEIEKWLIDYLTELSTSQPHPLVYLYLEGVRTGRSVIAIKMIVAYDLYIRSNIASSQIKSILETIGEQMPECFNPGIQRIPGKEVEFIQSIIKGRALYITQLREQVNSLESLIYSLEEYIQIIKGE